MLGDEDDDELVAVEVRVAVSAAEILLEGKLELTGSERVVDVVVEEERFVKLLDRVEMGVVREVWVTIVVDVGEDLLVTVDVPGRVVVSVLLVDEAEAIRLARLLPTAREVLEVVLLLAELVRLTGLLRVKP